MRTTRSLNAIWRGGGRAAAKERQRGRNMREYATYDLRRDADRYVSRCMRGLLKVPKNIAIGDRRSMVISSLSTSSLASSSSMFGGQRQKKSPVFTKMLSSKDKDYCSKVVVRRRKCHMTRGRLERLLCTLQNVANTEPPPSGPPASAPHPDTKMLMLLALDGAPSTKSTEVLSLFDRVCERFVIEKNADIERSLLHHACNVRDWDRAAVSVEFLESAGFDENIDDKEMSQASLEETFDILLHHAIVSKNDGRVVDICDRMTSWGLDLPEHALNEIFRAYVATDQLEKAMMCIDRMPLASVVFSKSMWTRCAALCGKLGAVDTLLVLLEKIAQHHDSNAAQDLRGRRGEQRSAADLKRTMSETLTIGTTVALKGGHVESVVEVLNAIQETGKLVDASSLPGHIRFEIFESLLDAADGSDSKSPLRAFRFLQNVNPHDISIAKVAKILSTCLRWPMGSYTEDAKYIFDEATELEGYVQPDRALCALAIAVNFRLRDYDSMLRIFKRLNTLDDASLRPRQRAIMLRSLQRAVLAVHGVDAMTEFTERWANDAPSCLPSAAAKLVNTPKGDHTREALKYLETYAIERPVDLEFTSDFESAVWVNIISASNAIIDSAVRLGDRDRAERLLSAVVSIATAWKESGRATKRWKNERSARAIRGLLQKFDGLSCNSSLLERAAEYCDARR